MGRKCGRAARLWSPACTSGQSRTGKMSEHDIVIVGAGPAGMRAAMTLADAGLRSSVIDEAPRSGGQIYRRPPPPLEREPKRLYGFEAHRAVSLHAGFDAIDVRVDHYPET